MKYLSLRNVALPLALTANFLLVDAAPVNRKLQQAALFEDVVELQDGLNGITRVQEEKTILSVEYKYWLQTSRGSDTISAMVQLNQKLQEYVAEAFAEKDFIQASITLDELESTVQGPCEEEFPTLPQLDCAIVNSAINVSFIPNTFMRVNEDYLKDATIAEVGRLFEDINDDNGGEMVLRLRSPIGVSTVLNFYFHNLNTPMGPVEMDIVKRSFFSVFESPLGLSDPSFTLTDVDVVLNAVLEERINTRRLHIRTNSDHTHASLRVDLFVQATCQGLLCDHGNFHSSLSDMVDDSRKKFVDTMKLKGHFTVQNDYFETLTFIKPFEHNFPGIPDDDNIFTFPSRSDGYEMPWWFWLSLVLVLAPITGFAVIVVLNARLYRRKNKFGYGKTPQKGNLFSPARKQTDCCRIIMDPGTEDKESPRNKSNGRAAVVKSPSSLCKKQQISTIAPISPTEAKYMFQKSPAKPCSPILEASSDSQTTSITGRSPKKSSSLALSSHRSLHSFSTSPPKSSPSKGTPIVVEEPPNQ